MYKGFHRKSTTVSFFAKGSARVVEPPRIEYKGFKYKYSIKGDIARFSALLEQYEKAPDVTRQRLYLETISEILPQLGSKVILDADVQQFLPLMNLQQLSPEAKR